MAIYLTSDWHLFKCQYGRKPEVSRNFEKILHQIEKLEAFDTLYFLGDLMDDTVDLSGSLMEMLNEFANALICASPRCYFIRGNNDVKSDDFYKSIGFNHVSFAEWVTNSKGEKILLSHTSVKIPDGHPEIYNIHGHIHRSGTDPDMIAYYHKSNQNINLCTVDNREYLFTNLDDIDLSTESKRNSLWVRGSEKPGMSQLCQNMATEILEKMIYADIL